MIREKRIKECSEYFKRNIGFSRIMVKIRDRYKTLGKIGGTVKIDNLKPEEKEALTGFLKNNYYKDSTSISIEKFQTALENTPFEGLELIEILEEYFGKDILTDKEKKEIYKSEKEQFFDEILDNIQGTVAYDWISYILSTKENAYRIISQRYDKDKEGLRKDIIFSAQGINNLPYLNKELERLAIFASKISKNPHTFDENTNCGRLLLYGIAYILGTKYPKDAEEKAEVLYSGGIIKDEISNFTVCSGVLAYRNGKVHQGWEGFYNSQEPLQISLWNLSTVDKITSPNRKVYIFENPTVFSEVLPRISHGKPSMVCTYGQVKLASLILLDRLVENDVVLYYSGDFDPEGLIIADKLKGRYKDKLKLWRYTKEDYIKSISRNKLDESRIKKLDRLKDETLIDIGKFIKEKGYAGYQESILEELVGDIS